MRHVTPAILLSLAVACGGSTADTEESDEQTTGDEQATGDEIPPEHELGPDGRDAARGCGDATSPECESDPTECQGNEVLTLGENDPTPGPPGCRCVPICDTLNPGPPPG